MNHHEKTLTDVAKITAVILTGICIVVATAASIVIAKDFILLIFLGVLFGVFLTNCAGLISKNMPLNYSWSLAIVTILLVAVLGGGTTMLGMNVEQRLDGMSSRLDEASERLESWLSEHPLAMQIFEKVPFAQEILTKPKSSLEKRFADSLLDQQQPFGERPSTDQASEQDQSDNPDSNAAEDSENDNDLSRQSSDEDSETDSMSTSAIKTIAGKTFKAFQRMFATTLGLAANMGLIFFVGLFLAVNPDLYRDGFAKLFPVRHRERITDVMNQMGKAMFAWLQGRFVSMLITGAGTGLALWFLGVPMAITIGIITALLTFIPNIGGIIALALAMLMALTQGPMTLLWVIVVYSVLQLIESNVITPLIQQHQTSIPPALLLSFQVILGALTGFMGLLVATPLLAAGLVAVRELWVKDVLNDHAEV